VISSFRWFVAGALVALSLAAPSRAVAQEDASPSNDGTPVRFGDRGEWVLGGSTSLGAHYDTRSNLGVSSFAASGSLGADRFVQRNLSLGLELGAAYSRAQVAFPGAGLAHQGTSWVRVGPRIGVNLPLAERFSFFPRLTLGVEWRRDEFPFVAIDSPFGTVSDGSLPDSITRSSVGVWASVYAPVLVHVGPHFFVGAGPRAYVSSLDAEPRVIGGVALEVGGHWGGAAEEASNAPDEETGPHLGDAGTLLLTNGLVLDASMRKYRSGNAITEISVEPGVDYFVARRVSLGFEAALTHQAGSGSNVDLIEAGPRVGVVVPLGRHLALYPRLTVGVGHVDASYESSTPGPAAYAWVGADAPFVVDVAPRFFVGFGPRFVQEVWRHFDSGYSGDRLTRIAAQGLLGGWI
jgi:hypothetical protein